MPYIALWLYNINWCEVIMDAHDFVKLEKLSPSKESFATGDMVKVSTKIKEGERERTQIFEGLVIRRRGKGPGATFTVRRISNQIGVERTFLLYSPLVEDVIVVRKGKVRRSRLNYIRQRTGRAAKIKEARSLSG